MKITEHIQQSIGKPLISFEILPPVKGKSIASIFRHLDPLMEFNPSYVNVTYHRAERTYKKRSDGRFDLIEIRKRPGTVGICAAIMNHYKVDAVPHLICGGFGKEETENALIDLHFLGIKNVLALRGDATANEKFFTPHPHGHRYAVDLVEQINNLNEGKYLEEEDVIDGGATDFCIGIAGYPEKHIEAANIDLDMHYLKRKIAAGANYIVSQMFFDNQKYIDYVKRCRDMNINVPIIPGLKPLTTQRQLSIIPSLFHVDIPADFTKEMLKCKNEGDCELVGTEWLIEQCRELIKERVPVLHFYTLGKPKVIYNVMKAIL